MKKVICCIMVLLMIFLTSCSNDKATENKFKQMFGNSKIDRIVITNTRYSGRYTIVDKNEIESMKNKVIKSSKVTTDNKLDPDYIIEFYSSIKKIASFKYIAGISSSKTANLIGEDKSLYHINNSIEDEFMKRLTKKNNNNNISDYYISTISLLIDKSGAKPGSVVTVDISKDVYVTNSITSVEQKRILDSVNKKNIKVKLPNETNKYDYMIKINTSRFLDNKSVADTSVQDVKNNMTIKYHIEGNYSNNKWNYFITYK